MTLEFKIDQIAFYEYSDDKPFIGYFMPNGQLIEYGKLLGINTHDEIQNPVSTLFLYLISYILSSEKSDVVNIGMDNLSNDSLEKIKNYINSELCVYKEYLKRNAQYYYKCFGTVLDRKEVCFMYDLLLFFEKAYLNNNFFEAINRRIVVREHNIKTNDSFLHDYYLKLEILRNHFKDICVQYLGYDSLERFTPSNSLVKPCYFSSKVVNGELFTLVENIDQPRIIYTSSPIPNERFFNYLLMGWQVVRLPRYYFNEKSGVFEKESEFMGFYQSEKEQILEQEIKSIRKLVPPWERHEYFR